MAESLGLAYGKLLMGFLIGRGLPGKFYIFLNALAFDPVEAFLAGRSHVEHPGFRQGQAREVKMEWIPTEI